MQQSYCETLLINYTAYIRKNRYRWYLLVTPEEKGSYANSEGSDQPYASKLSLFASDAQGWYEHLLFASALGRFAPSLFAKSHSEPLHLLFRALTQNFSIKRVKMEGHVKLYSVVQTSDSRVDTNSRGLVAHGPKC